MINLLCSFAKTNKSDCSVAIFAIANSGFFSLACIVSTDAWVIMVTYVRYSSELWKLVAMHWRYIFLLAIHCIYANPNCTVAFVLLTNTKRILFGTSFAVSYMLWLRKMVMIGVLWCMSLLLCTDCSYVYCVIFDF